MNGIVLNHAGPAAPATAASRNVHVGRGQRTACLVWLRHAPTGAGLPLVAGLPLAVRCCLEAAAAGFAPVFLAVPAADTEAMQALLATGAPGLSGVELLPDGAPGAGGSSETVVLFGDAVWDRSLTREAAAPLPPGCPARIWECAAGGEAIARVRTDALAVFLPDRGALDARGAVRERLGRERGRRVATAADAAAAERVLLQGLRKPADGVFSRHLSRPVSLPITALLARFPVRPNHVTVFVGAFGVLGASLASQGTRAGFVAAAGCWWVAAILDGCDGELARLKYLGTRAGAWLDTIVDDLSIAACILGLAVGLHRATGHDLWLGVGAIGLAGFCLTYPPRWYLFARHPRAADHQRLALAVKESGRGAFAALARWVKQTVVRSDFLPYFVLAGVLAGLVQATLLGLTLAMLAGVADTAMTFFVWRPRWVAARLEEPHAG